MYHLLSNNKFLMFKFVYLKKILQKVARKDLQTRIIGDLTSAYPIKILLLKNFYLKISMSNLGSGRPGVSPQDCGSIREIKNSSATPMPTPTQTFNFHFWRKQRATTRMFGLSQNSELNILFFPTAFCRPQKIKIQRFSSSSQ